VGRLECKSVRLLFQIPDKPAEELHRKQRPTYMQPIASYIGAFWFQDCIKASATIDDRSSSMGLVADALLPRTRIDHDQESIIK